MDFWPRGSFVLSCIESSAHWLAGCALHRRCLQGLVDKHRCVLVSCVSAGKALGFLRRWLEAHPTYRDAAAAAGAPPESSQALSHTSRWASALCGCADQTFTLVLLKYEWGGLAKLCSMPYHAEWLKPLLQCSTGSAQKAAICCSHLLYLQHQTLDSVSSHVGMCCTGTTHYESASVYVCHCALEPCLTCPTAWPILSSPAHIPGCLRAPPRLTQRTLSCSWPWVCCITSTGAMMQPLQHSSAHWSCGQGTTGMAFCCACVACVQAMSARWLSLLCAVAHLQVRSWFVPGWCCMLSCHCASAANAPCACCLCRSLWNKLGATLANYSHSSEAVAAYQKALDLKPNYMRAWTNMGISYANLGDYMASAAYYVRALSLNPIAAHVWGYLRTSLACAGQIDLLGAVDKQDMDALQKALPL